MPNTKTNGERLATMEANLENVLKTQVAQGKTQEKILGALQEIKENAIITAATSASKDYVDTKVDAIELRVDGAKKRTATQAWVTGTLSAIIGAVISLLIAYFITTVGRI
jgi:hypothetical protein